MRLLVVVGVAGCAPSASAAEPMLDPGLYRVEVRLELPNVLPSVEPMTLSRCVSASDLASGRAFLILSKNPLRTCDVFDYRIDGQTVRYRIACPGPNRGSAVAVFRVSGNSYRGRIDMDMGGKNMTMAETQAAVRIGDCR
jgi:hypothetical protein